MIFWGAGVGIFLSVWIGRFSEIYFFLGGIFGALFGLWLRSAVRKTAEDKHKELNAKLETRLSQEIAALKTQLGQTNKSQKVTPASESTDPIQTSQTLTEREESLPKTVNALTASPSPTAATPMSEKKSAQQEQWRSVRSSGSNTQPSPQTPSEPSAIERGLTAAKDWFLGGNTIVRVGIVILFLGLSFLARYAAASGLFPVELRLAAIGAVGIALLMFGFKTRIEKPAFALVMQGAGIAVMYLTVFAAFKLYALIPAGFSFALMLLICAFSCALALLQNSFALAFVSFAGAFACPILLSTGQGSHVSLFGYYTVLNLAIAFMAYKRSWRLLNLLGFGATFIVAGLWGVLKYNGADYLTTQPFLIGFILIFALTAIFYARNTPTQLGNAVDSTLIFGTALIGFGLQMGLVQNLNSPHLAKASTLYAAFSALGFGAFYLFLATILAQRNKESYRLLIECFIALGVGFVTLAVPLALDVKWTSAVWALEGLAAFWVGMRQARWMPRLFGLALIGIAAVLNIENLNDSRSNWSLLHPAFIGGMMVAVPAWVVTFWLRKYKDSGLPHSGSTWANSYSSLERQLATPLFFLGFAFWCLAWISEMNRQTVQVNATASLFVFDTNLRRLLMMMVLLISSAMSLVVGQRAAWKALEIPSRFSLPVMFLTYISGLLLSSRVLNWPDALIWSLALALHYWMLRKSEQTIQFLSEKSNDFSKQPKNILHWIHAGGVWFLILLLADMLWSAIRAGQLASSSWASVVLLVSAVLILFLLSILCEKAAQSEPKGLLQWPLKTHALAYVRTAALPLAALVYFGAIAASISSEGRVQPLPYIPLLNPVDITVGLAIAALLLWRRNVLTLPNFHQTAAWLGGRKTQIALFALIFIAINSVWLRVAHHFFGVSWGLNSLFSSFVVQTGYAILWTLIALSTMLWAHSKQERTAWLAGAGLLGVVVLKLMLIDLSNRGGAERIITFISVGILMLVVGYFAPLPLRKEMIRETAPVQ